MPLALLAFLFVLARVLVKIIGGVVVAGLVYAFLTSVVSPILTDLQAEILQKVNEFSTVGGTAVQVIFYLDFPHCVNILLSASAACFSIKLMAVAVRAFGINTG